MSVPNIGAIADNASLAVMYNTGSRELTLASSQFGNPELIEFFMQHAAGHGVQLETARYPASPHEFLNEVCHGAVSRHYGGFIVKSGNDSGSNENGGGNITVMASPGAKPASAYNTILLRIAKGCRNK